MQVTPTDHSRQPTGSGQRSKSPACHLVNQEKRIIESKCSPAHVAQDDARLGRLLGRPPCTAPHGGGPAGVVKARTRERQLPPAAALCCFACPSLHVLHPAAFTHTHSQKQARSHPPRSVLRRSTAQAPGAVPCHAHFCASGSGASGFCGRHSKPSDRTTISLKPACAIVRRGRGRRQRYNYLRRLHGWWG